MDFINVMGISLMVLEFILRTDATKRRVFLQIQLHRTSLTVLIFKSLTAKAFFFKYSPHCLHDLLERLKRKRERERERLIHLLCPR